MQRQTLPAILAFLVCACNLSLAFQIGSRGGGVGNLQVRITDTTDRQIGMQAHVQLLISGAGGPYAEGYCNNEGMTSFASVPIGTYHIVVSGDGLETTDSGSFQIDERKTTQSIFVRVKRTAETEAERSEKSGGVVGLQNLNVPPAANREFDGASEAMAQQDWKTAITRLNRAIALYPAFVAAYNNLGTVYQKMGDAEQERQALEKAIRLDEHFVPALLNLGLLSIVEKKYSDAETFLGRASVGDPTSPQIFMLLAQSQLMTKHFDQAIASKDKVHSLPHHEKYALAHYIAARALAHMGRMQEAANELQTLLVEQPDGPLAQAVRQELTTLRSTSLGSLQPGP